MDSNIPLTSSTADQQKQTSQHGGSSSYNIFDSRRLQTEEFDVHPSPLSSTTLSPDFVGFDAITTQVNSNAAVSSPALNFITSTGTNSSPISATLLPTSGMPLLRGEHGGASQAVLYPPTTSMLLRGHQSMACNTSTTAVQQGPPGTAAPHPTLVDRDQLMLSALQDISTSLSSIKSALKLPSSQEFCSQPMEG